MKKITTILIIIMIMVSLASCNKNISSGSDTTESVVESDTKSTVSATDDNTENTVGSVVDIIYPEDARGYMNYPWKNDYFENVDYGLSKLFPQEETDNYFEKNVPYKERYEDGSLDTVYNFIKEFDVKKEDFIRESGKNYSNEEIEVIFSEDKTREEVYEYFLAPYAIMVNLKVFGPGWLGTHDAEACRDKGITADMLEEKLPAVRTFMTDNFGDDYCNIVVKNIEKNIAELRAAG